ncbi:MAG: InlB B-repeat-containing protein, partial [Bacteroidaceae bacterium]|nr:InlB B-repeat-containing protein [Bacteroidaceae bacterium]
MTWDYVYNLIYKVDGQVYKTYQLESGAPISAEPAPTKEGYTFSGWSQVPESMPANDIEITGSFSINSYTLTYLLDGEVYKSVSLEYGAEIESEPSPDK